MATYGYAGDFSSDDDEKVEQVQAPAKYDSATRPSKTQIEEAIQFIKRVPIDEEVNLNDDILAGLLDYYQTQRGPIVDSTRKLYNKIVLRLVRDDQSRQSVGNDGSHKETTNGNSNNNNNNNNNNNGSNLLSKGAAQQGAADTFSSDDEDIEVTPNNPTKTSAKKFDSRVVYSNDVVVVEEEDPMEVDSESPSSEVRNNKPIELSTTDEDEPSSSSSDDDVSEAGDDPNSESSDVLEVTPIKPPASANREKEAVEVLMAMRPSTPKQTESSSIKRQQPLAHSTPKESFVETAKKPYTRSQRITTRSATKSSRNLHKVDSKNTSSSSADVFIEKKRASRPNYTLVTVTLLVLVLAFLAYYFRSDILNTAEPLFRKKISF